MPGFLESYDTAAADATLEALNWVPAYRASYMTQVAGWPHDPLCLGVQPAGSGTVVVLNWLRERGCPVPTGMEVMVRRPAWSGCGRW